MSLYDTDVFIVGGGPAGLAAAIAARRRGLQVILADAAEAPADKCCGEGLMPDAVAALRQLGIALPADSARFRGIRFIDGSLTAHGAFPGGTGFGIRRTKLHQLLLTRALDAGADCRFKTAVAGIEATGVMLDGRLVRPRWIVGADGFHSRVRDWAGLSGGVKQSRLRYGFRRHFQIEPIPEWVEVYWHGDGFQVFVTPVNAREVGVAMTTSNPAHRLDHALARLPQLRERLGPATTAERGAITANMSLPAIHRGNVVLIGDASGAVDSITGEGMCLAFRQAVHLAGAIAAGDMSLYAQAHQRLIWPPRAMARLLLWLADHPMPRHAAIRLLASSPRAFHSLLSAHAGETVPPAAVARNEML